MYDDARFGFEDGRARFHATEHREPVEVPDGEFPLVLTTGRVRNQWHAMTRTGKARPLGGFLADRLGGIRVLAVLYALAGLLLFALAALPPLPLAVSLLFLVMACLGTGNGSVFQLVPQRFGNKIGVATGVVGAAGGLGGFFLPTVLGTLKGMSGSYAPGLVLFGLAAAAAMLALLRVRQEWRAGWARADLEVAP